MFTLQKRFMASYLLKLGQKCSNLEELQQISKVGNFTLHWQLQILWLVVNKFYYMSS